VIKVDESKEHIEMAKLERGDVSIHNEWVSTANSIAHQVHVFTCTPPPSVSLLRCRYVVHGSAGNLTDGHRRTYVLAFRTAQTIEQERAIGFNHSHNTQHNWDNFDAAIAAVQAKAKAAAGKS